MTMYVVSVCPVIVMGLVGRFAMVVMVVFAVVMLGRYPSIVMVMDVRVVSSTVAMVSRPRFQTQITPLGGYRKTRSLDRTAALTFSPACVRYVAWDLSDLSLHEVE
jgi:hypothetical protein